MSKKREGGWSGIGMATVGIDPTNFGILNDHPTKIPPGELLGGVVKNCHPVFLSAFLIVLYKFYPRAIAFLGA